MGLMVMKKAEDNSCSGTSSFALGIFSLGLVSIEHWIGTHCLPLLDDLEEVCSSLVVSSFFGTHSCSCLTKAACLL